MRLQYCIYTRRVQQSVLNTETWRRWLWQSIRRRQNGSTESKSSFKISQQQCNKNSTMAIVGDQIQSILSCALLTTDHGGQFGVLLMFPFWSHAKLPFRSVRFQFWLSEKVSWRDRLNFFFLPSPIGLRWWWWWWGWRLPSCERLKRTDERTEHLPVGEDREPQPGREGLPW